MMSCPERMSRVDNDTIIDYDSGNSFHNLLFMGNMDNGSYKVSQYLGIILVKESEFVVKLSTTERTVVALNVSF